MDNYQYIIVGLPLLSPDFTAKQFSYKDMYESIYAALSEKDRRAVRWLEHLHDSDTLCNHIYRGAAKCPNRFIREWYEFDRKVRNAQVDYLSKKEGHDGSAYLEGGLDTSFEEYPALCRIFGMDNLIERERALDKLRWEKVNSLTTFHYFDIDVILGFLLKAMIVSRWDRLDKEKGAEMFETLVNEVRGTFKGVKFES